LYLETEVSETSTLSIHTLGNYPKEEITRNPVVLELADKKNYCLKGVGWMAKVYSVKHFMLDNIVKHWDDPGVDGRIILGWIFGKWDVGMWTAENFLTSCRPVSFSRRTLLHAVSK
jgi:hypothetical protein